MNQKTHCMFCLGTGVHECPGGHHITRSVFGDYSGSIGPGLVDAEAFPAMTAICVMCYREFPTIDYSMYCSMGCALESVEYEERKSDDEDDRDATGEDGPHSR